MKRVKSKGVKKLLPHEKELLASGQLTNITHERASAIWLHAESTDLEEQSGPDALTKVYRVMGDRELLYLLENKQLPDTQPYQTIVEHEAGREYVEGYLKGRKWVDSSPTTVVEFIVKASVIEAIFAQQHKAEDGVLSMGLGDKGGGTLPLFNDALLSGSFRIVSVKRKV